MKHLSRRALFGLALAAPVAAAVPAAARPKWRVYDEHPAGWVMYRFGEPGPLKPYVIGHVYNMQASLERPAECVYQFSSKPLGAVYGVRDGGEPLACPVVGENYQTLAELRNAHIKPGEYAADLSSVKSAFETMAQQFAIAIERADPIGQIREACERIAAKLPTKE